MNGLKICFILFANMPHAGRTVKVIVSIWEAKTALMDAKYLDLTVFIVNRDIARPKRSEIKSMSTAKIV